MDQYTRQIIGFGMHAGIVDGMSLCRMFQQAIGRRPAYRYFGKHPEFIETPGLPPWEPLEGLK
jgi:hypothetical protein